MAGSATLEQPQNPPSDQSSDGEQNQASTDALGDAGHRGEQGSQGESSPGASRNTAESLLDQLSQTSPQEQQRFVQTLVASQQQGAAAQAEGATQAPQQSPGEGQRRAALEQKRGGSSSSSEVDEAAVTSDVTSDTYHEIADEIAGPETREGSDTDSVNAALEKAAQAEIGKSEDAYKRVLGRVSEFKQEIMKPLKSFGGKLFKGAALLTGAYMGYNLLAGYTPKEMLNGVGKLADVFTGSTTGGAEKADQTIRDMDAGLFDYQKTEVQWTVPSPTSTDPGGTLDVYQEFGEVGPVQNILKGAMKFAGLGDEKALEYSARLTKGFGTPLASIFGRGLITKASSSVLYPAVGSWGALLGPLTIGAVGAWAGYKALKFGANYIKTTRVPNKLIDKQKGILKQKEAEAREVGDEDQAEVYKLAQAKLPQQVKEWQRQEGRKNRNLIQRLLNL